MKPFILVVDFMHVDGMALYPFILVRKETFKNDPVLIRHEQIHLRQQLELLILPFYLFYLLNYLINRIKLRKHDPAYLNIVFEKEASANEADPNYLDHRGFWAWMRYCRE